MIETVDPRSDGDGLAWAGRLLHDFNVEYDEPSPPPGDLARRLGELIEDGHVTALVARADAAATGTTTGEAAGQAVGVAVVRVQPSLWSEGHEAYLAELYVVPDRRGQGHGRALITEVLRVARERGCDYAFVITSEEDELAQRLYEAAGFRRTEGEGGPLMLAYERDL